LAVKNEKAPEISGRLRTSASLAEHPHLLLREQDVVVRLAHVHHRGDAGGLHLLPAAQPHPPRCQQQLAAVEGLVGLEKGVGIVGDPEGDRHPPPRREVGEVGHERNGQLEVALQVGPGRHLRIPPRKVRFYVAVGDLFVEPGLLQGRRVREGKRDALLQRKARRRRPRLPLGRQQPGQQHASGKQREENDYAHGCVKLSKWVGTPPALGKLLAQHIPNLYYNLC
jgi:hypothetical protein